jgi:hypothetical protein
VTRESPSATTPPSARIRGPVVGRKNHYGSKSCRGTEVAATFYRLIVAAKLHSMNPPEYLLAAVQAADHAEILMPWELRQPDAPAVRRCLLRAVRCLSRDVSEFIKTLV